MNTTFERATRAAGSVVIGADERGGPVFPDHYTAIDLARAVLMAVREPDYEMEKLAGWVSGEFSSAFTAMIDAILNEGSAK